MKQKLKKLMRKVGTSKSGWGKSITSNLESSSDIVISSPRKIANVIFRSFRIHVLHSIWQKLFLNPTTVRELFGGRKYEGWISSQKPECGQNPFHNKRRSLTSVSLVASLRCLLVWDLVRDWSRLLWNDQWDEELKEIWLASSHINWLTFWSRYQLPASKGGRTDQNIVTLPGKPIKARQEIRPGYAKFRASPEIDHRHPSKLVQLNDQVSCIVTVLPNIWPMRSASRSWPRSPSSRDNLDQRHQSAMPKASPIEPRLRYHEARDLPDLGSFIPFFCMQTRRSFSHYPANTLLTSFGHLHLAEARSRFHCSSLRIGEMCPVLSTICSWRECQRKDLFTRGERWQGHTLPSVYIPKSGD
jgi:hypothetical protein